VAGALISLLPMVNSTGEADKQQCQVTRETVVCFILVGVARSRGKQKGVPGGFSIEQRGKGRENEAGARHSAWPRGKKKREGVQQGQAAMVVSGWSATRGSGGGGWANRGARWGSGRGEKRRPHRPAWKRKKHGPGPIITVSFSYLLKKIQKT
jgi:hypothetical protein